MSPSAPQASLGVAQRQGQALEQRQQQRLALTPRMRQSLKLLQMPSQELSEFLEQQALENPLIDLDALMEPELDWQQEMGPCESRVDGDKFATASRPETLRDQLAFQASALPLPAGVRSVVGYLIDSLDERGYLPQDMTADAISDEPLRAVFSRALEVLQSLEPAGIGAHDLPECLILQLERMGAPKACTLIASEMLEQLAAGSVRIIAERAGISTLESQRCCDIIRSLEPIPARGWGMGSPAVYSKPEAVVREGETGGLEVTVVGGWSSRLRIAGEYEGLASSGGAPDEAFIAGSLKAARELIDDVRLRESTVLSLIDVIVRRQREALFEGPSALVPMTMEEVAEQLGVNVSTVSRAAQDKWLLAPFGMMSLRSFFTKASFAQAGRGEGHALSGDAVRARLAEIIAGEDAARPLSDQSICDQLVSEGIEISRRTVAKYRDALGIPGGSRRRRR